MKQIANHSILIYKINKDSLIKLKKISLALKGNDFVQVIQLRGFSQFGLYLAKMHDQ